MTQEQSSPSDAGKPQQICGYEFTAWLKPGQTALCRGETGQPLTLKRLDADCLLEHELHPDIHERLARIREIPHQQVATLLSVERDSDGAVWMVWEHVQGQDFLGWACDRERPEQQVGRLMRELVIAVETLHAQGIVHGALRSSNIITDPSGGLHLIDVSPLLYSEEAADAEGIRELFEQIIQWRGAQETSLGRAITQWATDGEELSELSSAISRAIAAGANATVVTRQGEDEHAIRRRMIRRAIAAVISAAVLASITWYVLALRYGPSRPPNAPPEAMKALP